MSEQAYGPSDKVHRLLAVVKRETVNILQKEPADMVSTWPYLVVWEFLAVLVFSLGLAVMSWLVNAPLVDMANSERTPNPAKAPWYFLNLQEPLLHMDPAMAGVIVPGLAIFALMILPYLDNESNDPGRWFTSARGRAIAVFAALYSVGVNLWLVLFDHWVGVKRLLTGLPYGPELAGWVIPVLVMVGLPVLLVALVRSRWQADRREVLIALFTGFFVTYIVLTIISTAFRGPGMELFWPWDIPHSE